MLKAKGYAGFDASSPLKPFNFERRTPGETDVLIDIKYCGVCHSDIHSVRNEWKGANYPMVPGHEIVGIVQAVGSKVKHIKPGDAVGVGCMVNSCGHCSHCNDDLEQFCDEGCVYTYNSVDRDGSITKGGYSDKVVVDEEFVLKIPVNLKMEEVAPLLCAGITTYSPLRHWKIGKNHKVGVVGLGGLGHMAIKFAKSFGAHVVLFTTSPSKKQDALAMGADEVVISKNSNEMKACANSLDFILDTVSAPHGIESYLELLKTDGVLCMVGASPDPHQVSSFSIIGGRKSLAGSLIGGIAETQEMLDYCGQHKISCMVEVIPIDKINEAYERMMRSDVKYRFVIDMNTL